MSMTEILAAAQSVIFNPPSRSIQCPCSRQLSPRQIIRAVSSGGLTSINLRLIYASISTSRFEIHDMERLHGPRAFTVYETSKLFSALATTTIYCNTREVDELC